MRTYLPRYLFALVVAAALASAGTSLLNVASAQAQTKTFKPGGSSGSVDLTPYLQKSGDTMTGQLVLGATGIKFSDATTLTTAPTTSTFLAKSGGTMTGQLVLAATGLKFSDATVITTAPQSTSVNAASALTTTTFGNFVTGDGSALGGRVLAAYIDRSRVCLQGSARSNNTGNINAQQVAQLTVSQRPSVAVRFRALAYGTDPVNPGTSSEVDVCIESNGIISAGSLDMRDCTGTPPPTSVTVSFEGICFRQ